MQEFKGIINSGTVIHGYMAVSFVIGIHKKEGEFFIVESFKVRGRGTADKDNGRVHTSFTERFQDNIRMQGLVDKNKGLLISQIHDRVRNAVQDLRNVGSEDGAPVVNEDADIDDIPFCLIWVYIRVSIYDVKNFFSGVIADLLGIIQYS